jgi:hypothetical protein
LMPRFLSTKFIWAPICPASAICPSTGSESAAAAAPPR